MTCDKRIYYFPSAIDFVCILLSLFLLTGGRIFSYDSWWQLAVGREILATFTIPQIDSYSFSAAGNFVGLHSWLSQVILACVDTLAGLNGVTIFTGIVFALIFKLNYSISREFGASPLFAGFSVFVFAITANTFFVLRPQIFTYLFLSVVVIFYLRSRFQQQKLWPLLILYLLWANMHGGFILGIAFLFGFAVLEFIESKYATNTLKSTSISFNKWLKIALIAMTIGFITPSGIYQYANAFVNTPFFSKIHLGIDEWGAVIWQATPLLGPAILLGLICFFLPQSKAQLSERLLYVGATVLSVASMRNVPIFGILALPILSTWLSRAFHPIEKLKQNTNDCTKKVMPLKIILSSALVLILVVYSGQIADTAIQKTYPVSAMKWLKEHPTEGNIFNPYEWGGYLIYYYPEQKVFIDSRMAPYIPEVANDYEAIKIQLPGWQDLFAKYEMKTALIQASDQSLVVALESMENWQRVYRDPVAEIFVISENR